MHVCVLLSSQAWPCPVPCGMPPPNAPRPLDEEPAPRARQLPDGGTGGTDRLRCVGGWSAVLQSPSMFWL